MTESIGGGVGPKKLLAGAAIKFTIVLVSVLVLALGAWLAPRSAPPGLSASQEHAAPILEEQAQLRHATRPFAGVQEAAEPARRHSVTILRPPFIAVPGGDDYAEAPDTAKGAAGFGVYVTGTHVLTHSAALDGRPSAEVMTADGFTTRAQLAAFEPATGLVLLLADQGEGRTPAALAAGPPSPGQLAVGVGRSGERDLAVPVFVTGVGPSEYAVGGADDALLPGMPIFALTGELLAMAAPGAAGVRALPVRAAAERLLARAAAGERRASFGLGYQQPTGPLAGTFGTDGVIVTDVLPGGPADAADLRVGDVLLAVGGAAVGSEDSAARLLSSAAVGAPTTLSVRRGSRVIRVDAVAAGAYEIAALARSHAGDAPHAPEARVLLPAAVLEASNIPPSARVVSLGGRAPSTRSQAHRELARARQPVPVLLRADGRQFFVAVEPAR